MIVIGMDGKKLEEALEKIASKDSKKAAEGIAIASGIESESIAFYTRQAEKAEGEMESFFGFLARQEKQHLEAIKQMQKNLEEKGLWKKPALEKKETMKVFSKKDWDRGNEEGITAILFALWKEKQAQEFYLRIANSVESSEAKQFFEALAAFEKGHADLLAEYVEDSYYTRELIMG